MRTIYSIIIATLITFNLNAQKEKVDNYPKLFKKLVLDIGAVPISISNSNYYKISSYSLGLGYQVTNNFDIRINNEIFTLSEKYDFGGYSSLADKTYRNLWNISLGANYKVLNGKSGTRMENTSLSFVGKFGAGISTEFMEQETLFYDLSVRGYLGRTPYIGIGVNRTFSDYYINRSIMSLYLSFGIDF
ncbi:MAG TPA: hypothetical protein EYP69_01910 [Bacteroidales bacterium]|nr:hypothetical protein [Bacteroidales bacterium]